MEHRLSISEGATLSTVSWDHYLKRRAITQDAKLQDFRMIMAPMEHLPSSIPSSMDKIKAPVLMVTAFWAFR
jgi:hypothetical protein